LERTERREDYKVGIRPKKPAIGLEDYLTTPENRIESSAVVT